MIYYSISITRQMVGSPTLRSLTRPTSARIPGRRLLSVRPPLPPPARDAPQANWKGKEKAKASEKSPHARWYADIVPAMIPVALLGSAVYVVSMPRPPSFPLSFGRSLSYLQGLQLWQTTLSTEKYLDEANARIQALEDEIELLRKEREEYRKNESGIIDRKETSSSRWWFTST